MAEKSTQRKLAAILVADLVVYSRLMGEYEAKTLAAVTSHISEAFEPEIKATNGRIFKTTGDGLLAEFASAVDAVQCAVAVQEQMRERNSEIREERRIDFRIGVHIGDVIVQDDDLYGDGVNIAARLEGLATPGGIVVSGMVHEMVRSKLDVAFDDLGPQVVKNIAKPVHAFGIQKTAGRTIPPPHSSLNDPPVIGFVDDDPMEVEVFERVFGDQYRVFASTRISDIVKQMEAASVSPDLMVLDLYYPSGRNATEPERKKMIQLMQKVDNAQRTLSAFLSSIGQSRDGGLQLLKDVQQIFPSLPAIFFTRKGTIDDVVVCLDAGAKHVLKKPQPSSIDTDCNITELTEKMEAASEESRQFLSLQFDRLLSQKSL